MVPSPISDIGRFSFPSTVFRYNDFEFVFDDIARQILLVVFLRRLVKGTLLLALLLLGSED
jgi:hypothetical protein